MEKFQFFTNDLIKRGFTEHLAKFLTSQLVQANAMVEELAKMTDLRITVSIEIPNSSAC